MVRFLLGSVFKNKKSLVHLFYYGFNWTNRLKNSNYMLCGNIKEPNQWFPMRSKFTNNLSNFIYHLYKFLTIKILNLAIYSSILEGPRDKKIVIIYLAIVPTCHVKNYHCKVTNRYYLMKNYHCEKLPLKNYLVVISFTIPIALNLGETKKKQQNQK